MKVLLLAVTGLLLTSFCFAQNTYQIRADSVRIYNTCDTAELILENRTRDTIGFLFNKGNGRTEFKRLHLVKVGASQLAIQGQDTLDLSFLGTGTANVRGTLKDFITSAGNTSAAGVFDNLYTYSVPAGKLAKDGDKLFATYGGTLAGNVNAKSMVIVIGGNQLTISLNSTTSVIHWKVDVFFIRTGETTGRFTFVYAPSTSATIREVELTGLDFNSPIQFNLQGAGVVAGDVIAKQGTIIYEPAAL